MVIVLDIRTACDLEAHAPKNVDDLVHHQCERVLAATRRACAREGDVDTLLKQALTLCLALDRVELLTQTLINQTFR